jgi:hypothetical protein
MVEKREWDLRRWMLDAGWRDSGVPLRCASAFVRLRRDKSARQSLFPC